VVAVDECRGAYDLALGRQMWRYPNNPNGVLDIGGGTAIARLFAPGGALLRDADIVLPGTSHLAQRLAAAILPKVGSTADAGSLMDSIASETIGTATPTSTSHGNLSQFGTLGYLTSGRN
jgi:hypothetical protein